jgi:hypothetical protein
MAKKTRVKVAVGGDAPARGGKSAAIREYMAAHKNAMPKEIVAALKERGIEVSPNLVSILRAKAKVKGAKKKAAAGVGDGVGVALGGNAAALDAALTLYKAARTSPEGNSTKTRQAFLLLVETFG